MLAMFLYPCTFIACINMQTIHTNTVAWTASPHSHLYTASTDTQANSAEPLLSSGCTGSCWVQLWLHLKGLNIPVPSVRVRQHLSSATCMSQSSCSDKPHHNHLIIEQTQVDARGNKQAVTDESEVSTKITSGNITLCVVLCQMCREQKYLQRTTF